MDDRAFERLFGLNNFRTVKRAGVAFEGGWGGHIGASLIVCIHGLINSRFSPESLSVSLGTVMVSKVINKKFETHSPKDRGEISLACPLCLLDIN